MSEDAEIVEAFLEEGRENLDRLERDLVVLETRPDDPELLAQVYRAIHTIKGTCGFLGYERLEALTHAGEDLLDALRSRTLAFDADIATLLLALIDAVRAVLDRVEVTGEEGGEANAELIRALAAQCAGESPPAAAPVAPESGVTPSPVAHESSVRVDVAVLDSLMDLVGELVLTRSQIGHLASEDDEEPIVALYRQLARITADLQENVMQARLQPIGAVTGRFPRIARDLAASMDKRIRVELEGEDVGVDRAVNEALKDALLHLVRNTVDHGIESPAERTAAGKDPEGCLRIRAFHVGGRVHVELSDDGRGIDPDRLAARAVAAGALSREAADALSPDSALQLMFLPGLSTKEAITTVSGRGVGMDAVRAGLDQLGASIDVSSEIGRGTVFRIDVPLTLAILPALLVWAGGGRYALPQIHVREVIHLQADEVLSAVDAVDGALVHRLRGRLLPLVELAEQLRVKATRTPADGLMIVVAEIDRRSFGIIVDDVDDPIDAVVKPLPTAVRSIAMFAGVTILSDGRPALIADLDGLAAAAGLVTSKAADRVPAARAEAVPETSVLLATMAGGGHLAVDVSAVLRLEHFSRAALQHSRGDDVVHYADAILPLIVVADVLAGHRGDDDAPSIDAADQVPTIICRSSIGPVGLVVESIQDVVTTPLRRPPHAGRRGDAQRLVICDRVTELIDVEALLAAAGAAGSH